SFCDLAWAALGIDPVNATVTTIDLEDLLGRRDLGGPLLIAQAWSRHLLSELKLLAEELGRNVPPTVTILHHLGLDDEVQLTVPWEDLDRTIEPDHLTSLYLSSWPAAGASVSSLLLVVERLRRECPWDRDQTHQSLGRHLLEESYEVLDALEELGDDEDPEAVRHLEEELGDLLVQVLFHAVLAGEYGGFSLADIAETVSAKLIFRHPHVFGDVQAETAEEVAANWEVLKQVEKQRSSITDGIPESLPALALVAKLQRKGQAIGMERDDAAASITRATAALEALSSAVVNASTLEQTLPLDEGVGELLSAIAQLSQLAGVDPEAALRQEALTLRSAIRAFEASS
ncbi:MAG: MazG family protein, partial [Actinomycetota bacterium]